MTEKHDGDQAGSAPKKKAKAASNQAEAVVKATERHPSARGRKRRKKKPKLILGWREYLVLSELGVQEPVKAKVDTGAATSSLHAHRIATYPKDGEEWVRFTVYPRQRTANGAVEVEAPVHSWRTVRSSNGKRERRPVIKTTIDIAGTSWPIDVTLTSRAHMGFRMLLGRRAVRGKAVVDVSQSYLAAKGETL